MMQQAGGSEMASGSRTSRRAHDSEAPAGTMRWAAGTQRQKKPSPTRPPAATAFDFRRLRRFTREP